VWSAESLDFIGTRRVTGSRSSSAATVSTSGTIRPGNYVPGSLHLKDERAGSGGCSTALTAALSLEESMRRTRWTKI
jgi:hypothetical protein